MSINEWSWRDRVDLTKEKGWVLVKGDTILEYDTFTEASEINSVLGGHLMSKNYYNNHYKKQQ